MDNQEIDFKKVYNDEFDKVEYELSKSPHVDIPNLDLFAPGVYARAVTIPKGTVLTSLIHKTEHIFIIAAGAIAVITQDGPQILKAPHWGINQPGSRRMGEALEDTVWITIHHNPTDTRDMNIIRENTVEEPNNQYIQKDKEISQ